MEPIFLISKEGRRKKLARILSSKRFLFLLNSLALPNENKPIAAFFAGRPVHLY
jgi:hypothetical protein